MGRISLFLLLSSFSVFSQANLMITAVYDGPITGGVPKGVELYVVSDIPDLSIYGLGGANNGGGSDGEEFTFPADVALAGSYLYVASEAVEFENFFGFAPNYTSAAMSINGDDAIELFANGALIDIYGDVDIDGTGTSWEYLDGWAYRISGMQATTAFNVGEWQLSGTNAWDGETQNTTAVTPLPVASFQTSSNPGPNNSQVLINEVDADTESTDILEFVELFDGGTGNTPLDGLVLVFYCGNNDQVYASYDLDGLSTDAEGYFVAGNPGVTNVDFILGSQSQIQNGADAIALFVGDSADFPNGTSLVADNIQDAIVYGTNDADDLELLSLLLPGQPQVNESGNNGSPQDSSQRCENGSGGQRNTLSYVQTVPSPGEANSCIAPAELHLISAIQGTPETQGTNNFGETDVSPLIGQQVIVEAVVVGDFQQGDADEGRNLNGFYLQEESSDEDGNPQSSEGLFVYDLGNSVDVNLGDLVRVTGTVDQYFGETQLEQLTAVEVLSSNNLSLVAPAVISLSAQTDVTVNQDGNYQPDLEAYEGMWVVFNEALTITEQFQLDRFNEIKLVAGERPYQFTQINTPDSVLFDQAQRTLGARRITYDDGLSVQNTNIGNLDGFSNYSESSGIRMGDRVTNLTGVLDYKWAGSSSSGATWRVRSVRAGDNAFTSTALGNSSNPRPEAAPEVEGTLKVTSFNVLNFFTTIDFSGAVTAAGHDPRGADTDEEFLRQLSKTINALMALDADVVGLVEIENEFDNENDGSTAIEVLVNALNDQLGSAVYDYVYPGATFVGGDAIAVAMIYNTTTVAIAEGSTPAILTDSVAATLDVFAGRDFSANPIFDGVATNRASLAVSFTHLDSDDTFTVVANHFKSKGSSGLSDNTDPNFDQQDGAGFWNARRLDAATAVNHWLATAPTGIDDADQIILGDLNAYAMEAPVQYLLAEGFNNVESPEAYSYVFDGQIGTLDYLLLSDSLYNKMNQAVVWHINADEADAIDYNLDFGRSPDYFDSSTATRNSDHDPVLVGLDLVYVPLTPADLLAAYNVFIESSELAGTGKHIKLQQWRQFYFATILESAIAFAERGLHVPACALLNKAARRSNGNAEWLLLISGPALGEMHAHINTVRQDLGCPAR